MMEDIMYRLNKLLEEDLINMITTDEVIDDSNVDDMIETIESQPDPSEKESLFEPKTEEDVDDGLEESGIIYTSSDKVMF